MADAVAFEDLGDEEALARLDTLLAKLDAELARPREQIKPAGRPHSDRTKRKLAETMFERRRAETLLAGPSKVASQRLAADLSQRQAAEKALIDQRSWQRAEQNYDSVSPATQRRIARALGVSPDDLR